MVANKKTIDWHAVDNVSTPSQTRAYIDACKEWLLAIPEDEDDTEVKPHQDLPIAVEPCRHDNNGMVRENICGCNVFKCFMCNSEQAVVDGRLVVANPFTRSQCMLLCSNCDS